MLIPKQCRVERAVDLTATRADGEGFVAHFLSHPQSWPQDDFPPFFRVSRAARKSRARITAAAAAQVCQSFIEEEDGAGPVNCNLNERGGRRIRKRLGARDAFQRRGSMASSLIWTIRACRFARLTEVSTNPMPLKVFPSWGPLSTFA